jgi:Reverse transcriptase (RNA-dependent DNA polymerase)
MGLVAGCGDPAVQSERYADDAVVHCVSPRQAREVPGALQDRMAQVGLQLHPEKTKITYTFAGLAKTINPIVAGSPGCSATAASGGQRFSAPGAHQRLPGAMDPQEIQAAPGNSQSPPQAA